MDINPNPRLTKISSTDTLPNLPTQPYVTSQTLLSEKLQRAPRKKISKSKNQELRKKVLTKLIINKLNNKNANSHYTDREMRFIKEEESKLALKTIDDLIHRAINELTFKTIDESTFKMAAELLSIIINHPLNKKAHGAIKIIVGNLQKEINVCKNENKISSLEKFKEYLKLEIRSNVISLIYKHINTIESYIHKEYTKYTIEALKNLINSALEFCDDEDDKKLLEEVNGEVCNLQEKLISVENTAESECDEDDKKILDYVMKSINYSKEEFISINKEINSSSEKFIQSQTAHENLFFLSAKEE